MTSLATNQCSSIKRVWWLDPTWLFAVVVGGTVFVAAAQSENAYRMYGTPKYIDQIHVLMALGAIAAFAFGRWFAASTGEIPKPFSNIQTNGLKRWFYLAIALTLFGYGVWFASAVRNGLSLDAVRQLIAGTHESFREEILKTIPGVTTCTQFGIAAAVLGTWLVMRGEKGVMLPLAIVIALAAARALFNFERLAMIEVILPVVVIIVRLAILGRPLSSLQRQSLQFFPLLSVAGLVVLFGAFEYLRSWRYYQHDFNSFAEFTVWRLVGYYTTALNNGAMALEVRGTWPIPYATLNQFWQFPLVENSPLSYYAITGLDPEAIKLQTLDHYGAPEFNSDGGLFLPALDFGVVGFIVFWLAFGFLSGRLYRSFVEGSLAGIALYPLVFVSLLEVPRVLYLTHARSFAPLFFLLALVVAMRHCHVPARGRTMAQAYAGGTGA